MLAQRVRSAEERCGARTANIAAARSCTAAMKSRVATARRGDTVEPPKSVQNRVRDVHVASASAMARLLPCLSPWRLSPAPDIAPTWLCHSAAATFMAIWYAAAANLASDGVFQTALGGVPRIVFALAVPVAIALSIVWLIRPLRRAVLQPDIQPLLIAMQSYRVAGLGFIVLMVLGMLPAIFAIPAGLGDLIIGFTAFGAASAARKGHLSRAVWWNVLGLPDLSLALTLGLGSGPSQFGFIATTPRSTLFALRLRHILATVGVFGADLVLVN